MESGVRPRLCALFDQLFCSFAVAVTPCASGACVAAPLLLLLAHVGRGTGGWRLETGGKGLVCGGWGEDKEQQQVCLLGSGVRECFMAGANSCWGKGERTGGLHAAWRKAAGYIQS